MKNQNNILTIAIIAIIASLIFYLNYVESKNASKYDLKEITYDEIITKKDNNEDFILIVSRSNCSHCTTYKPKVQQICKDYKIVAYYIDIDNLSNMEKFLTEFNLKGATPMTLFFKNGKETTVLNRLEGDLATSKVIEKFKELGFIDK